MLAQDLSKKQQYIEHILKNLPHKPGVYKMKSDDGRIMYIGKAKDLKNRVSSYFKSPKDKSIRTLKMVEQIADLDYTVVNSDLEAIILETNLIKELRPKYNVLMKDDKNYVYLKITVNEPYPRIYIVRKVAKDKARYFGPKTAAHKLIKTLKLLKRIFPFRNCQLAMDYGVHGENKYQHLSEAQLTYHKKHCLGPCIMNVSPAEYRAMVDQVIGFFEGKHENIIQNIKEEMHRAAAEKKFEIAAAIRDKLNALEDIIETQRVSDPHLRDLDIINYVEQDDKIYFNLFQIRGGKLIDQENFIFKATTREARSIGYALKCVEDKDALSAFLEQYYEKATDIAKEILIPHEIDEPDTTENWLSEMKGQKVKIIVPERGKKNHLLELSLANAQSFARQSQVKWQGAEKGNREQAMEELQNILKLTNPPHRMECYDISHFQGTETVGSMVAFEKGFPKKEDYRHFKLHREKSGEPNDFASMEEILTRRLKYLKPSIAAANLKLRKPKKKELKPMAKALFIKKLPAGKIFYVIEKEKKYAGFVQILETPDKKALIEKIEFEGRPDLTLIIKKTAEKAKVARIYIKTDKLQIPLYEETGCRQIQKVPEFIKPKAGETILVYDKTRHIEDKSFRKTPDLIVVDGGKGQLSSALKALRKYQLPIPLISIAKKEEEIFVPGLPQSIRLQKDDPVLHLIRHIRDESHRFAITYHHKLRLRATTTSALDAIYGIGPELKMKLLRRFGSPENIKSASVEELSKIVGPKAAKRIKDVI